MAATELGLGTCWICSFNTDIAKDFLKLEENIEPIVLIPVGYAAEPNREKIRKTTEEIITFIE
jgi:nitroreductase